MKSLFLIILPLVLQIGQFWDETPEMKSLRTHVEEICLAQNEGRPAGSEGEKNVAHYIYDVLSRCGAQMLCPRDGDIFGVVTSKGDTLSSRNVAAVFQGGDKQLQNHYIVVGARMDGMGVNELTVDGVRASQIYHGANGNASGLAMLLDLADMVSCNSLSLKRSVIFVAFGASSTGFAGAWSFIRNSMGKEAENIDAMINLDILGIDKEGLLAYTSGNADINHMLAALSSSVQPIKPKIIGYEPYPSDHQVFYNAEIPSILFTSGRYTEHNTPKDTPGILDYAFMEREKEYIFNFILHIANGPAGVPAFRDVTRTEKKPDETIYSWGDCDVPPMFLNNPDPTIFLKKWVYPYLKYPEGCIKDGVQGRVMVEFIIREDGRLTDAHVTRGIDEELDAAALKVICASPKWRPARHNKKRVACSMTIPVEFRLKKKK